MRKSKLLTLLMTATLLTACGESTEENNATSDTAEETDTTEEATQSIDDELIEEEKDVDVAEDETETQAASSFFSPDSETKFGIAEVADTSEISGLYHLGYGPGDFSKPYNYQIEYYVNIFDDGRFNYLGASTELDDGKDNYQGARIHTPLRGRGTYVDENDEVVVMDPPFLYNVVIGAGYISGEYGGYTLNNLEYATVYNNESSNPYFGKDTNGEPTIFLNQLSAETVDSFLDETDASLFNYNQDNELIYEEYDFAFDKIDSIEDERHKELMSVTPYEYTQVLKEKVSDTIPVYDANTGEYTINSASDLIQLFRYKDDDTAIPLEIHASEEFTGYYTEENDEVQPKFVVSLGQPLFSGNKQEWTYENVTTYAFDEGENTIYSLVEQDGNKQAHIIE